MLIAAAAANGDVTEKRVLEESPTGSHWFLKGGGFPGQHHSPLRQIDRDNVARLGLVWSTIFEGVDGIAATPIVVDGVVYLSLPESVVVAVSAETGEELWRFDPEVSRHYAKHPGLSWSARANRGVAVWGNYVYVATAACELIALERTRGEIRWSRTTCDINQGYRITDSPYVGSDLVFVGNGGSESGQHNRGYVSAYEADSGELAWRFYTVPSASPAKNTTAPMQRAAKTWSGEALQKFGGGGSVWNEMTYDPDSGLLFFGTAGSLPYVYDLRSPGGGDNLYTSSVIALKASTGEYVWHYQTVPADSWDYNANMNLVLATLPFAGRERDVVMIAPKNGFFYVLDKLTGELLRADQIARVNWASHIDIKTGRPVLLAEGQYWNKGVGAKTILWPNMWGAHNWQPMAFQPRRNLVYVPIMDLPSALIYYGGDDFSEAFEHVEKVDGKAHRPGKLLAWDPVAGEQRWIVEFAEAASGGVLTTAGGLVFQGNSSGEFVAYDDHTGVTRWSVQTGTAINAAPVSYQLDARQFVLIPVGVGGGLQYAFPQLYGDGHNAGPAQLMAFALDAEQPIAEIARARPPLPDLPESPRVEAFVLEEGWAIYLEECGSCHGHNARARPSNLVPDLRYSTPSTHLAWEGIVLGGAKRAKGMPRFSYLTRDEVEAVRAFVLNRRDEDRRAGAH